MSLSFIDGKLYTLQSYLQPHTQIFYNKDMFAEAGIVELPRSWDEFEEVSAKLKEAGFTPLLTGGDWMTTLTFSILTGPEIFGKNPNWYADKNAGLVSYQDDNSMAVAERYHRLAEKGYFNKGALSIGYEQVEQEFLNGTEQCTRWARGLQQHTRQHSRTLRSALCRHRHWTVQDLTCRARAGQALPFRQRLNIQRKRSSSQNISYWTRNSTRPSAKQMGCSPAW